MTTTEQPSIPAPHDPAITFIENRFRESLDAFAAHTAAINESKGFCTGEPTNVEIIAQIMLVVTELAEAVEGLRKNLPDDKVPARRMVEVELGDAVIRCLNISQWAGYDLSGAIIDKSRYNETRPYRHGDKAL